MDGQPEIIQQLMDYVRQGWEIAESWLLSPAAWSQFALLIAAYLLSVMINRRLRPLLKRLLTPQGDQTHIIARARLFVLDFTPLLLPLLAYVFTGLGESVTRSLFDSGAVIAFGNRVFIFLGVRILVRDILKDPFLRLLGKYVLLPMAALYAVGLLETATAKLKSTIVPLGNMSFDLLWLLQAVVAGGVVFWLGRWSNDQSTSYIHAQQDMRPATRQLAAKAAEIAIFGAAFLLLMNILGISLTSLAVLGGAIGVGLGFGLQKIAANFISGVILLVEGQATVGDYVELDGGEAGTIVKTTARAMILETFDGRWIVVPNEDFITTRVVNYSDQGSANRYEAEFSVSYDADVNRVPEIIEEAVSKLDFILQVPDGPDCELRAFGDSGVEFAVEFWVNGIDDGKNRFTPVVMMTIWNALKDNNIEIPYPQRVVHHKGLPPEA
ncbi:mechanosensitive ion channel [Roseovarius nubinhibens]|uniref:Mechanosensitive ion channel family protein n=2 Tax=Roseovarius nubinhibens TaxID=314263 RepID=A3SI99_ROSNI|nr:mechanosensitive ion channel domain-containing protein [Roseovarius nubinhibens]EAP77080.1 mechanosensitive ion channel family protein [Roseovarius nubinhibens ISM]MBU2999509.1 mechanosensitive ion channel [Roseovarius nubinhibens]HAR53108.1 mechanosensitive ion channel protein MscS [Roseovarius nubinhibens]